MTVSIKLDAYLKVSCVEYNQEVGAYEVTAKLCIAVFGGRFREVKLPPDVCLKAVVRSASNPDDAAEKGLYKIAYEGGDNLIHEDNDDE